MSSSKPTCSCAVCAKYGYHNPPLVIDKVLWNRSGRRPRLQIEDAVASSTSTTAPSQSRDVLPQPLYNTNLTTTEAQSGVSKPSSYRGDSKKSKNRGEDITDQENTSVFVTNLPHDCTVRDVLSQMHGIGKIWACNMCPPTPSFLTCAMKIVFWDRAGLEKFIAISQTGTFSVRTYHPEVKVNRFRTASQPASQASRVVGISGPPSIVNKRFLDRLFSNFGFFWDTDQFVIVSERNGIRVAEYAFASYSCQAESAMHCLNKHIAGAKFGEGRDANWAQVQAYWARDPCEARN